jgi:hypothetical protein
MKKTRIRGDIYLFNNLSNKVINQELLLYIEKLTEGDGK